MDQSITESFIAAFNTYHKTILQYCAFKCDYDMEAANEITQEAFLILWKEMQKHGKLPADNMRAWLIKIADNKLSEHYRKRDVQRRHTVSYDLIDEHILSIIQDMEEEINREKVDNNIDTYCQQILDQLTSEDRQLFSQVYSEHLSYREISLITGKTELALRLRMHRIRDKIKQLVKDFSEKL